MSKVISRKARSGRMRVMFMAYPFLTSALLPGWDLLNFCYLLEPCRLKLRPVQNAAPELQQLLTGAESQLRAGINFLNPAFELTLRRPCFRS